MTCICRIHVLTKTVVTEKIGLIQLWVTSIDIVIKEFFCVFRDSHITDASVTEQDTKP